MRILLYGGCHAQVLRDYLRAAFPADLDCTLIVNFELIRNGMPFPYESLQNYDFVIFSPIENKAEYNTDLLVAMCRRIGVPAICFPWLEWHGYCPGAAKGVFKHRFQWYYPGLIEKASVYRATFDEFCDDVIATFPDDDAIDSCFASSTVHFRAAERRNEMSFSIAEFLLENFRKSRLFLVPDHPSGVCYQRVFSEVLRSMGTDPKEVACRIASVMGDEPQWRWRMPIMPRVARRLGLDFEDTTWFDDEIVPGQPFDLRTYLSLYFFSDSVVLGPRHSLGTILRSQAGDETTVDATTRLLASPIRQADAPREEYRLLQTLSGGNVPVSPQQSFVIDPAQWRSSWPV